jgi:hypothetical protein
MCGRSLLPPRSSSSFPRRIHLIPSRVVSSSSNRSGVSPKGIWIHEIGASLYAVVVTVADFGVSRAALRAAMEAAASADLPVPLLRSVPLRVSRRPSAADQSCASHCARWARGRSAPPLRVGAAPNPVMGRLCSSATGWVVAPAARPRRRASPRLEVVPRLLAARPPLAMERCWGPHHRPFLRHGARLGRRRPLPCLLMSWRRPLLHCWSSPPRRGGEESSLLSLVCMAHVGL